MFNKLSYPVLPRDDISQSGLDPPTSIINQHGHSDRRLIYHHPSLPSEDFGATALRGQLGQDHKRKKHQNQHKEATCKRRSVNLSSCQLHKEHAQEKTAVYKCA